MSTQKAEPTGLVTSGTSIAGKFLPIEGKILGKARVTSMIDSVLKIVHSRAELLAKLDAELPPVMLQCAYHMQKHGDVSLADRLVKGVWDTDQSLAQELIFWFKKYTPINWGPDQKAYLRDQAEHPFNTEGAEATPYHQEPEVQNRRQESKRTIQPFGSKVAFQRVASILSQLEKAQKEGGRGIAEGEDPTELKGKIEQLVAFARGLFGITESPVTTIEKTPEKSEETASRLLRNGKEVTENRAAA